MIVIQTYTFWHLKQYINSIKALKCLHVNIIPHTMILHRLSTWQTRGLFSSFINCVHVAEPHFWSLALVLELVVATGISASSVPETH